MARITVTEKMAREYAGTLGGLGAHCSLFKEGPKDILRTDAVEVTNVTVESDGKYIVLYRDGKRHDRYNAKMVAAWKPAATR